jgi:hypothetical protein
VISSRCQEPEKVIAPQGNVVKTEKQVHSGYDSSQMEQYAHLLIASDPDFVPDPSRVEVFFDMVQKDFQFQFIKAPKDRMPGLMAMTSAEVVRTMKNPFTGEERTFRVPKWFALERTAEIVTLVADEAKYGVMMSGKWPAGAAPIELLVCDGKAFEEALVCTVLCMVRANPVCTGDWWGEDRNGECEFGFGDPNGPIQAAGVFTHPWTGKRVDLPNAGSSRFWIEFEFGKWLLPKMTDNFDVLQPAFVDAIQNCLGVRFVQAGRAVG